MFIIIARFLGRLFHIGEKIALLALSNTKFLFPKQVKIEALRRQFLLPIQQYKPKSQYLKQETTRGGLEHTTAYKVFIFSVFLLIQ